MRIAVTGSSGLIGSALVTRLRGEGHEVLRVVRSAPTGPGEVRWDPATGTIDQAGLAGIDGAVHLAGEGIGEKRWTAAQKQRILDSRVQGTRLVATALASLDPAPAVLVSGSAVGFYGVRGDEVLTEASGAGTGFLADVAQQWEAGAAPASAAGIRTVLLRTGIVLAPKGGAFGRIRPLLRLGLAGRLGSGKQWWSWITLEDEVRLIVHALTTASVSGPMNATAPNPATFAEVIAEAGRVVHRPTVLPVPAFALKLVMGAEMTEEVVLASQRALPAAAEASGFTFTHPELRPALESVLVR